MFFVGRSGSVSFLRGILIICSSLNDPKSTDRLTLLDPILVSAESRGSKFPTAFVWQIRSREKKGALRFQARIETETVWPSASACPAPVLPLLLIAEKKGKTALASASPSFAWRASIAPVWSAGSFRGRRSTGQDHSGPAHLAHSRMSRDRPAPSLASLDHRQTPWSSALPRPLLASLFSSAAARKTGTSTSGIDRFLSAVAGSLV
jgi:hypothetical protein